MLTIIVVMVAVFAMIVGPIAMIAPTKSQKRIAKLRAHAHALRLQVRLVPPPARASVVGQEGRSVAQYLLRWRATDDETSRPNTESSDINKNRQRRKRYATWLLVRGSLEHAIHFSGKWEWVNNRKAPAPAQAVLREILATLFDDVIAVEADEQGLSMYWWERGDAAELDHLLGLMKRLQGVIEEPNEMVREGVSSSSTV